MGTGRLVDVAGALEAETGLGPSTGDGDHFREAIQTTDRPWALVQLCTPGVLDRYIFQQVMVRALAVTACLGLVLLSIRVLGMVSFLFTARQVVWVTLQFSLLQIPPMVVVMLPFAVLIAIHRTFDEMHQESELVVMAAVGRSRGQRAAPAILAGGLLSLLCLGISLLVEPYTNSMADRLKAGIGVDIIGHAAQTGGLTKLGDNLLIQVGGRAADNSLMDVLIVDSRGRDGERVYFAKRGLLSAEFAGSPLLLSDGEVLVKNQGSKVSSHVQFSAYMLSLSELAPRSEGVIRPQGKATSELMIGCETNCVSSDNRQFKRELHRRFSDWLYVLAFAVITAGFGSRSRPNRNFTKFGVVGMMLIGLVLRGVGFVALDGSATSIAATVLVYLIPISASLFFSAFIYDDGLVVAHLQGLVGFLRHMRGHAALFGRIPAIAKHVIELRRWSSF